MQDAIKYVVGIGVAIATITMFATGGVAAVDTGDTQMTDFSDSSVTADGCGDSPEPFCLGGGGGGDPPEDGGGGGNCGAGPEPVCLG